MPGVKESEVEERARRVERHSELSHRTMRSLVFFLAALAAASALPQNWPAADVYNYRYGFPKAPFAYRHDLRAEEDDESESRQDLVLGAANKPVETGSVSPVEGGIKVVTPAPPKVVDPTTVNPLAPAPFPPPTRPPQKDKDKEEESSEEDESEEEVEEADAEEPEKQEDEEEDEEEEEEEEAEAAKRRSNMRMPSDKLLKKSDAVATVVPVAEKPAVVENASNVVSNEVEGNKEDESEEDFQIEALVPGYVTDQGEVLVPVDTVTGDQPISIVPDPYTPVRKGIQFGGNSQFGGNTQFGGNSQFGGNVQYGGNRFGVNQFGGRFGGNSPKYGPNYYSGPNSYPDHPYEFFRRRYRQEDIDEDEDDADDEERPDGPPEGPPGPPEEEEDSQEDDDDEDSNEDAAEKPKKPPLAAIPATLPTGEDDELEQRRRFAAHARKILKRGRNEELTSFPPSRTPELYAFINSRIPAEGVDFTPSVAQAIRRRVQEQAYGNEEFGGFVQRPYVKPYIMKVERPSYGVEGFENYERPQPVVVRRRPVYNFRPQPQYVEDYEVDHRPEYSNFVQKPVYRVWIRRPAYPQDQVHQQQPFEYPQQEESYEVPYKVKYGQMPFRPQVQDVEYEKPFYGKPYGGKPFGGPQGEFGAVKPIVFGLKPFGARPFTQQGQQQKPLRPVQIIGGGERRPLGGQLRPFVYPKVTKVPKHPTEVIHADSMRRAAKADPLNILSKIKS